MLLWLMGCGASSVNSSGPVDAPVPKAAPEPSVASSGGPPPAPMRSMTVADIMAALSKPKAEKKCLPFLVTQIEPVGEISKEGDEWLFRPIVRDAEALAAARKGKKYWMPEDDFAYMSRRDPTVRETDLNRFGQRLAEVTSLALGATGADLCP